MLLNAKACVDEQDPVTGDTVLHAALSKKQDNIEALLALKADPNARNTNGGTPIHVAVLTQSYRAAQLLLDAKGDPNTQANSGFLAGKGVYTPAPGGSPIGSACRKEDRRMVDILLDGGARIDANALDCN